MHMFNIAVQGGRIYIPKATGTNIRLKAWATFHASTNEYTLVIINKKDQVVQATITCPLANAIGKAIYMTAPTLTQELGVTTAGRTLGSGGFSGSYTETVLTSNAGTFSVSLPYASAVLVRFTTNSASGALF
jgi:uncharacterized protein involved in outer membrane biogenesis